MDISLSMSLRQVPAHHRRMSGFLLAAVVLHSFVLFGSPGRDHGAHPELPDWVNIKLVAGIDEAVNSITPVKSSVPVSRPKPVENKTAREQQAEEKPAKPVPQPRAQHFVRADSRPFAHENPRPFYPAAARNRGMQGIVLLLVDVDMRGKVSQVEVKKSSGYRLLDESAVATVARWRFVPAKRDDRAVASRVEVPIRFELIRGS